MGYRNKTYVIFDGDYDMWAYGYMKGWRSLEHLEFDFNDAHDLKPLTDRASDETIKARLRERFANTKQVILLVGENTKYLYKFVRWEIEIAMDLGLPIVVVNLNDHRVIDNERCPPLLRTHNAIHVAFKMKIIKHALDDFAEKYGSIYASSGPYHYPSATYQQLGL